MAWPAVVGAIAAVASAAGSMSRGGNSSYSETHGVPFQDIGPGAQQIWDDFVGIVSSEWGETDIQKIIAEDTAFRDEKNKEYLDRISGINDAYKTSLTTSPENMRLGGVNYGIIPKRQIDTAGKIYDADMVNSAQNLDYYNTYTPNHATMQYLDWIYPKIQDIQSWRFRTPSSATTSTTNPSMIEQISDAIGTGDSIANLIDAIRNNNSNNFTNADVPETYGR